MRFTTPRWRHTRPVLATATLIGCAVAAAAAGCAGDLFKQPYPAKAYFGVEPGTPDPGDPSAVGPPATRPATTPVLLVRAVRVVPPYDGLAFVYRTGPDRFATDYYVNWIASPSALLTGGLAGWLGAAGPLPVVGAGSAVRPDYVLDAEVTRLMVDRGDPARPRAVVAARFFLTRADASAAAVVSDTSYSAAVPAASDTPADYAAAFDQAYRQVLRGLAADLRVAVARQP